MQLYYFALKTAKETIPDLDGQELSDGAAARLHATAVARQLMRNREIETRNWRIQVSDDYLQPLFEVYFAEADATFNGLAMQDGLATRVQASIEGAARASAALRDAVMKAQAALNDVRQTLDWADRILASMPGAHLKPSPKH